MDRTLEDIAAITKAASASIDCVHSLEQDMHQAEWFVAKVRADESYAQNVYAALCNNEFQEQEMWEILREKTWSCTWRYAGGIIADIRDQGDYIDWYCSGMGQGLRARDDEAKKNFVSEGTITPEVQADLEKLGWIPVVDQ